MGARLRSKCASFAKSSAKNSQSIERSGLIFILVLGKAAGDLPLLQDGGTTSSMN
jgi:hypothetical protein